MLPSPFLFGRAVSVIGFLRRMIQKIHSRRVEKSLHVCAKSLQLCLTLSDPVDCSPPGSSVHGILQARILEWVAMPSSRGSSQPKDPTRVSCCSCIAGGFFTTEPLRKARHKALQNIQAKTERIFFPFSSV